MIQYHLWDATWSIQCTGKWELWYATFSVTLSSTHLPLNINTYSLWKQGRLKLVLRLDKGKSADAGEKEAPVSNDSRPKRTPNPKTALDDYKIPKKPNIQEEPSESDERPSRKRKSTMDANFVFDPIYSKKEGEEDDDEEEAEHKKPKKKTQNDVPTPPMTEHDMHSGFKLKLKLPKPAIPDATTPPPKTTRPAASSEGRKKRFGEEDEEVEPVTPRSGGVKLKIRSATPQSEGAIKKPKPDIGITTRKHSPPRREELPAKKEPKIETHERRETRPKRI